MAQAVLHCRICFAANPGRLPSRALRRRGLSAARPSALRVRCRAVRATRQPWRVHVDQDGHGSCASLPASGARPAHGRPSCCQFRVVCTHPVSRPGRAAHSPHEARPEPVMATYSAVPTPSRRAWLRSALRAPCDRARYPMRASPRCRSPRPPRRAQRAYSPPQARGPRASGRDGATRSG